MTDSDKVTLRDIYQAVTALRDEISDTYVTKEEFWPVRTIVYGGAGIVLTSVVGAIVYLVVQH